MHFTNEEFELLQKALDNLKHNSAEGMADMLMESLSNGPFSGAGFGLDLRKTHSQEAERKKQEKAKKADAIILLQAKLITIKQNQDRPMAAQNATDMAGSN